MNEIGLHENEERSSYDILEYVPKNFKSEVSSIKTPSLAPVGLPLLGIKKIYYIFIRKKNWKILIKF